MCKWIGKAIVCLSTLIFLQCLGTGIGFSQTKSEEESSPDIKLGEIRFQIKELTSTPSPLKMLEVHVEVLNRSRQATAAANSIKLVLVPTETKYPEGTSGKKFDPGQQETTIGTPLPPASGRIVIFGFSLPEKIPESITFEVQLNSPEGEKKTATWESDKT
ncbi:MAG TPA: hypothetical protein VMV04_06920 [Thermodesulfobacteriota bacterium]|nr:hypothetical protein [Thermodesulfobacteriota bacterium]